MTVVGTSRRVSRTGSIEPTAAVRRDLEGVRALAVLGVVIYHLRPSWLPGGFAGVDVFFVLSGFFITGLLLRETDRSSSVDLLAFWGRRARRLLPAAAVVMIGTVLAGLVFVNSLDAHRFAVDGVFTSVFSVNWHYAALGTSYLADPDPSPLTHYWSLGVEEQFYVVWPVVLLVLAVVVRRRYDSGGLRRTVGIVAIASGAASFLLAWHLTSGDQPYAYFATYSRAWQLALGAGLAAGASALARLPLVTSTLVRWAGVTAIVGFYVFAPLDIVYPGWLSLIPALGTAAIIGAGLPPSAEVSSDPVRRALSSRGGQLLGRYSYGWYLWHWPPLVLVPLAIGHPLRARYLIACAVLSLAAAVVSYHVLEHPVRASRRLAARRGRLSLVLGAAIIVVAAGAAQSTSAIATWRTEHTHIANANGAVLHPQPGVAAAEEPVPLKDGCEVSLSAKSFSPECRYLPDSGHGDVVLVGDSHAVQWFSGVRAVAAERGWGLRAWTRASCPLADVSKLIAGGPSTDCNAWRENVMGRLLKARPSLVIVASYASIVPSLYDRTSGKLVKGAAARALYETGLRKELSRLRNAGIPVLLIRDNPAFTDSGPKCALEHPDHLAACSVTRQHALQTTVELDAANSVPGVHVLDNSSVYCDARRCHQVIGSMLAYRDSNHLTLEMVASLTARLGSAADQAIAG